jgi:hypothetical protein
MLYVLFWVIPRRLNFVCLCFGTLCLFHLHRQVDLPAYEDGTDRVFRNVGIQNSDAGELPLHRQVDLPAYEDGTDRVFRNIGIKNSDAGELPRRKHTIFRIDFCYALIIVNRGL